MSRDITADKQLLWLPQQRVTRTYQLYVSQLLSQSVRVTADSDDVPLYGLWLGLENSEPIRGRGADFCQDLLVLAECGEFAD